MAISKDDILEAVGAMSVMDLNDLVKAFEEKFGVSAAAVASSGPAAAAAVVDAGHAGSLGCVAHRRCPATMAVRRAADAAIGRGVAHRL